MFVRVAQATGCFQLIPAAYDCNANKLTISVAPLGCVETVPVVVAILVKTPVEGVIEPIGLLSNVLLVIAKPD